MAIEALLYESTTLSDKLASEINSVPPSVVDMKIKPEPPGAYGFPGHWLEGKLENPKLWSSEQVCKKDFIYWEIAKWVVKCQCQQHKLCCSFLLIKPKTGKEKLN